MSRHCPCSFSVSDKLPQPPVITTWTVSGVGIQLRPSFTARVVRRYPTHFSKRVVLSLSLSLLSYLTGARNNAPVIRGWQYTLSGFLHETQPPNTFIFQVDVTDNDPGSAGDITFTIAPLSPINPQLRDLLKIDSRTGLVTSAKTLDFDTLVPPPTTSCEPGMYQINATDRGTPPHVGIAFLHLCFLDENDNAPLFVGPLKEGFILNETTPVGSEVFSVMATDVDQGRRGEVSYFLDEVTNAMPESGTFAIDRNTGIVQLLRPLQVKKEYILLIIARDGGDPSKENVTQVRVFVLTNETDSATLSTTTPTLEKATTLQHVTTASAVTMITSIIEKTRKTEQFLHTRPITTERSSTTPISSTPSKPSSLPPSIPRTAQHAVTRTTTTIFDKKSKTAHPVPTNANAPLTRKTGTLTTTMTHFSSSGAPKDPVTTTAQPFTKTSSAVDLRRLTRVIVEIPVSSSHATVQDIHLQTMQEATHHPNSKTIVTDSKNFWILLGCGGILALLIVTSVQCVCRWCRLRRQR